jgi:hypothetical protein
VIWRGSAGEALGAGHHRRVDITRRRPPGAPGTWELDCTTPSNSAPLSASRSPLRLNCVRPQVVGPTTAFGRFRCRSHLDPRPNQHNEREAPGRPVAVGCPRRPESSLAGGSTTPKWACPKHSLVARRLSLSPMIQPKRPHGRACVVKGIDNRGGIRTPRVVDDHARKDGAPR